MENIRLKYDTEKGETKSIEIGFKVPSAKVKSDLDILNIRHYENSKAIDEEHKEYYEKLAAYKTQAGGDEKAYQTLYSSDESILSESMRITVDAEAEKRNHTIRQFKKIINDKPLITAHKELVNSDITDDFWQEQDYTILYKAVEDFLLQYPKTIKG